jgi:hypothetical protein
MLSACGYDDQITGLDVLVDAVDGRFACPRRECQDLVDGVFLRRWSEQETPVSLLQGNHEKLGRSFKRKKEQGAGAIRYLITNLSIHRHCHEH